MQCGLATTSRLLAIRPTGAQTGGLGSLTVHIGTTGQQQPGAFELVELGRCHQGSLAPGVRVVDIKSGIQQNPYVGRCFQCGQQCWTGIEADTALTAERIGFVADEIPYHVLRCVVQQHAVERRKIAPTLQFASGWGKSKPRLVTGPGG